MSSTPPPFPQGRPTCFRSTIHGTVFADRERHLDALGDDEPLRLHADPPGQEDPDVWVHLPSGDLVGHLPPEVSDWLWPWLRGGGQAQVRTLRVRGADVPSWRRVVIEVNCVV